MTVHHTRSEGETTALGRALGRELSPGAVVLLTGTLGAGKTAFVRGLAAGLGCDPDDVSSPTFTLIQEYRGTKRLWHVDLYRIAPHEVDDLGLEELLDGAVMAVEWPERWPRAPSDAIRVSLDVVAEQERRITIAK